MVYATEINYIFRVIEDIGKQIVFVFVLTQMLDKRNRLEILNPLKVQNRRFNRIASRGLSRSIVTSTD